jgi:hypothetical protein
MLRDVVEVRLLAGYRVFLKFDDGVQGELDLLSTRSCRVVRSPSS